MKASDQFERVYVINLKRRPDRRRRLEQLMKDTKWPFKKPIWFDAVDGSKVPPGNGFISGGGAWGCRQSWSRILEECLNEEVKSVLVLEDDAVWRDDFASQVKGFFDRVPSDWECVFLGGQNMATPRIIVDGVGRSKNTQRTHAIGLRGGGIRKAYHCMVTSDRHIDHRFGPESGRWTTTYQPVPFLIGQDSTQSDISGRKDHARFWASPKNDFPICWIRCPQQVADSLTEYGFHRGFDRDGNGRDRGLAAAFPQPGEYAGGLKNFVSPASWEAASFVDGAGVVTIWDVNATAECEEAVMRELPDRAKVFEFNTLAEGLRLLLDEYGKDVVRLRRDQRLHPVLLLKTAGPIVERLRNEGRVHTGRWRDPVTGIDRGLLQFFEVEGRSLKKWFTVLEKEARETNVPVGIYHPKADEEVAATTGRRVLVVDATDYETAIKQIEEGTR